MNLTSSTGEGTSTGGPKCQPEDMMSAKSTLWAANSSQGTISKIDTETVTEIGRFVVRPDSAGSPSRTSVSLTGHVAVANRNGGVTKIYGDSSFCQDTNGVPGIQTSMNNTFLPWGQEECIAWHTPFNYSSQRPVAWGPGVFNEDTCKWEEEEVWTAATNGGATIDVFVLDGDDGSIKEMISVPTNTDPNNLSGLQQIIYGIYGGAVDPDGNFWGSQLGSGGKLIRIIRDDMSYKIWKQPVGPHWYGMSVDADGRVFLCSSSQVGRFDPMTETWATAAAQGYTGCMADSSEGGLLWMSNGSGVIGVNRETLVTEKSWPGPGSYGVSVDFDGFVWAVANGSTVSKINKETGAIVSYAGLTGAYTYSDMIGYSLAAAINPQ